MYEISTSIKNPMLVIKKEVQFTHAIIILMRSH